MTDANTEIQAGKIEVVYVISEDEMQALKALARQIKDPDGPYSKDPVKLLEGLVDNIRSKGHEMLTLLNEIGH